MPRMLGHTENVYLILLQPFILTSIMAALVYTPTFNTKEFSFPKP